MVDATTAHGRLIGLSDRDLLSIAPDATHQHASGGLYRHLGPLMNSWSKEQAKTTRTGPWNAGCTSIRMPANPGRGRPRRTTASDCWTRRPSEMPLGVSIRMPANRRERYMRGGCFAFAKTLRKAIRRETGELLPYGALWLDGRPHHAFLIDHKRAVAYDCRGSLPLDPALIGEGSSIEGLGTVGPITQKQMREWAGSMDGHNARIDIDTHVTIWREEE